MARSMARKLPLNAERWGEILEAAQSLCGRGGVMAVPTESFYALAAGAHDRLGITRVQDIKHRSAHKPLLLLIADPAQLNGLVARIPKAADVLMKQFWPGPLTLVFPAAENLLEPLTAGTGTVGIRLPACQDLMPLLQAVGPLTGTSANRSGAPPAQTAEEVEASMGSQLDLIVNGGRTPGGRPSTIVDTAGQVQLIREGPIPLEEIQRCLLPYNITIARIHA